MSQAPCLNSVFEILKRAALAGKLGHGLLLVSGSSPDAARARLKNFVQFLLCTDKKSDASEPEACGRCESCQAYASNEIHEGVHPDLFWLRPDSSTSGYSVDQIKNLRASLSLSRSIASERVILLEEAEALGGGGGGAANALLKLLEEPRPNTRLLLLSRRPEGILPTIRSRCQLFRLPTPLGAEGASTLSPELSSRWEALWNWIEEGFPSEKWPRISFPADEDGFFKEREGAQEELRGIFSESWRRSRNVFGRIDLERSREALHWFESFDTLLASFRFHGQGALQWSAFKSRAKLSR